LELLPAHPIILVCDDSADDQALTTRFILKTIPGARVVRCNDGSEALDFLMGYVNRDHHEEPALVFLDHRMPKLKGSEVMDRLIDEERLSSVPVVLFCSDIVPSEVEACLRAGVRSFVPKPSDYAEYADAVKSILHYWLGTDLRARMNLSAHLA